MAMISSIDINNGVMMRNQDMSMIKAHEDARPAVEQAVLQEDNAQQSHDNLSRVNEADNVEDPDFKFDAREEGSNEYTNNRKKKKKEDKKEETEGSVRPKYVGNSFDMTI